MKLREVHTDAATRTRASAPGIKALAMSHSFAPAGASLAVTAAPAPSRHI